jgi:hypothetical protein
MWVFKKELIHRFIIFVNFFTVFYTLSFSQNTIKIKGILKDSITNEKIEYANIILLNADSSFIKGAVSDSIGLFTFTITDELQKIIMQFNHLNYEKKFITLNDKKNMLDSLLIFLNPKDIPLSKVEIIGKVTRINNKHNRLEYRVSDKLRDNSLLTTQILENIPNIFVDFNKNIFINGRSNILILKNGQELQSNSIVDMIPASSIEKVEVWKSIPAKYASQNYSAILNIITKQVENKSLILDNSISFDKKMYDSKINLSMDLPKHSFYLFYKLYYRDFLEKSSIENKSNQLLNDTIFNFITKPRKESDNEFFYGYTYYLNKRLTIGADGYLSLYKEHFKSNYDDNITNANYSYSNSKEDFTTQNYKVYLNYGDSLNKLAVNLQYNNKNLSDDILYYDNEINNKQREKRETFVSQIDYRRQLRENLDLTTGVKYSYVSDNNWLTNFFQSTNDHLMYSNGNNLSVYAESNIEIKNWSFDIGFNLYNYARNFPESNINVTSLNLYPKASIGYYLNNNSFEIAYYSYINNPSIWQLLPLTQLYSPNVYYCGNPYLKPEKYSVLSLEHSYSKGDFYIANNLYYKPTQNKVQSIINEENDNIILMSSTNLGNRQDYGYSISLGCNLTKWWNVNYFNDLYYRTINENTFYKKNMFSYNGNIQSVWELTEKLILGANYQYNSRNLVYNGVEKAYNSSLIMVKYKLFPNLDLFLMAIQPFEKYERKSEIYNNNEMISTCNNIKVRTYLFSFTYNLFKNKKKSKKLYNNEEKKY